MKTILFALIALAITIYVDAQSINARSKQVLANTKAKSNRLKETLSTSMKKNPVAIAGKKNMHQEYFLPQSG